MLAYIFRTDSSAKRFAESIDEDRTVFVDCQSYTAEEMKKFSFHAMDNITTEEIKTAIQENDGLCAYVVARSNRPAIFVFSFE